MFRFGHISALKAAHSATALEWRALAFIPLEKYVIFKAKTYVPPITLHYKKIACVARLEKWTNYISACLKSRLLYFTNRKDTLACSPVICRAKILLIHAVQTLVSSYEQISDISPFLNMSLDVLSFPLTELRKGNGFAVECDSMHMCMCRYINSLKKKGL